MIVNNFENDLLSDWINELQYKKGEYAEPILAPETVNLIKLACDTFNQDIHVLIMSVDILEEYIRRKNAKNEEISENVVTIAAIIFMSSKYMGEQDLKVQYIEKFLNKITGKTYFSNIIKLTEMEILSTLDNKLPVTTRVDDLNAFVTKYERECRVKATIRPLCLDILEVLYMTRDKWFFELKTVYNQNEEALDVFKSLMSSRLHLPVGILIYTLSHTYYRHSISIESIIKELMNRMQIHSDHINVLVWKIHETVRLK
ncbi:hypothetical protein NQ314_009070 [Rhamnusium bicolor]|uniref:Cyclin N-terminal domain-containing protein n=1 Tax=Rhamnusium bicolor TaxID=1586634 RepID=A0AAV8Y3V6_9CUCU|nr:hypothetical protein NQ314_009070 [Rhamnusium bicolor]